MFILEKSRTRHIAYCRRTNSRLRSRKKSCLACTKAKTRCDLVQPSCSRCDAKKVTCRYYNIESLGTPSNESSEVLVDRSPETVIVPSQFNTTEAIEEITGNKSAISDISTLIAFRPSTCPLHPAYRSTIESVETIPADMFTWGIQSPNTVSSYFANLQGSGSCQLEMTTLPRLDMGYSNFQAMESISYHDILLKPPKYFWPSTIQQHRFSLNKQYLLCTLNSYPCMILPGKSLPPFIHPHLLAAVSGDGGRTRKSQLPKPLASCAAIMQMFTAKNESNVKFIWEAIRMEQERMISEVRHIS